MSDEISQQPAPASTAGPGGPGGPAGADGPDAARSRRASRVMFLGGTSRSRSSVGVAGVELDVVERESVDGEEPPPAGCPCTSGF